MALCSMDSKLREFRERAYHDTAEIELKTKEESGFDIQQPWKWGTTMEARMERKKAKTLRVGILILAI